MEIVDENIILRYLLGDVPDLQSKSKQIIENTNAIIILDEVIAEVVYVLEKVYQINRQIIANTLTMFMNKENILCRNRDIICLALYFYETYHIDFVDSILLAFSKTENYIVHTFDKKLQKLIDRKGEI